MFITLLLKHNNVVHFTHLRVWMFTVKVEKVHLSA